MPQSGRITANLDVIYPRYDPALFIGREWLADQIAAGGRHAVLVAEPGAGKSAFVAYLAEAWNCPRHFIRADNVSGITGLDPRAFLLSIGTQLFQKYGPEIFAAAQAEAVAVTVGLARDKAEVVGRLIEELHTPLPFLPPREVKVRVGVALGEASVIGERVRKLVSTAWDLPETALLHVAVLQPLLRLHSQHPGEKVVILIDALDEALQHRGASIMEVLPRPFDPGLPPNLHLVMTTRPVNRILAGFVGADVIRLDDEARGFSQRNREDARRYVQRRLAEAPLAPALAELPDDRTSRIVAALEQPAEVNFLYLYHYLNALQAAAGAGALDLANLPVPRDLDEIYRFFAVERIRRQTLGRVCFTIRGPDSDRLLTSLRALPEVEQVSLENGEVVVVARDPDAVVERSFALAHALDLRLANLRTQTGESPRIWVEKYLPVLGVLTVAREAVDRTLLVGLAGVEAEYVAEVLSHLSQFLDEVPGGIETRYRLFHSSFREYLTDPARNRDFPLEAARYHARIAAYYRHGCAAWNEVNWNAFLGQPYPFRHLAAHLLEAQLTGDLMALLTGSPAWMEIQFQATLGDAAFRADLELAISSLADPLDPKDLVCLVALYTARQVVAERASTRSDSDLQLLVYLNRPSEACAAARLRSPTSERLRGLSVLHETLREAGIAEPDLYPDLLSVVRGGSTPNERIDLGVKVAGLVARAGDSRLDEVVNLVVESCQSLTNPKDAEHKLGDLVLALAQSGSADQVRAAALRMPAEDWRGFTLRRAAEVLAERGRFEDAGIVLAAIEDRFEQDQARHKMALWAVEHNELARAESLAAELAGDGWQAEWSSEILGELALAYQQAGDPRVPVALDEACRRAGKVDNRYRQTDTWAKLGSVLGRLGDARARVALEHAVGFVLELSQSQSHLEYVVRTIGSVALGGFFGWAHELVFRLNPGSDERKDALGEIALALASHGRYDEAMQVAAVMVHLRGGHFHRNVYLTRLADQLAAAGQFDACLKTGQMIHMNPTYNPYGSWMALATWLVQNGQRDQAAALAAFARKEWDKRFEGTRRRMQVESGDDRQRRLMPIADLAEAFAVAGGRPDHWAFELALELARGIPEAWESADALRRLALCLARWRAPGVAALYAEAQAADRRWATFYERKTPRLQQLSRCLAEAGDFLGAERLLSAVPAGGRESIRRDLAAALAKAGQGERALQIAAGIQDPEYRREASERIALAGLAAGWPRAPELLEEALRTLPPVVAYGRFPNRDYEDLIGGLLRIGCFDVAVAIAQASRAQDGPGSDPRVRRALAGLSGRPVPTPGDGEGPPPGALELAQTWEAWAEGLLPLLLQAGWFGPALELVRGTSDYCRPRLAGNLASALIRRERYTDAAQAAALCEGAWLWRRSLLEAVIRRAVTHGFRHEGGRLEIDGVELVKPLFEGVWKHAQALDLPGLGLDDIQWNSLDGWQALIYSLPSLLPRSLFDNEPDVISSRMYDKRHDVYGLGITLLGEALLEQGRYDDVLAMVASTSGVLYRDGALLALANGLAAAGQTQQARTLIGHIGVLRWRGEATQKLSESLAKTGRFAESFLTWQPEGVDRYLEMLQQRIPELENAQAGLAYRCLTEATRIAGWTRPDWAEVERAFVSVP